MDKQWTTYQLTIQLIVDNRQQKSAKELEDFYRELLTSYEGTKHHTKWCVVKTDYQCPTFEQSF